MSKAEAIANAWRRLFGRRSTRTASAPAGATSFALPSPALARQAMPLLGHRSFTEKHHIKASQLEASRSVNAALKELRGGERKWKGAGA